MSKTTQKELLLQSDMLKGLQQQGFFATKTSDRFKAGRPDIRLGRADLGQLDIELKYIDLEERYIRHDTTAGRFNCKGDKYVMPPEPEIDYGLKKIQWLKVKEMNEHGMPAIVLVFVECLDLFFVTTLLRDTLPPPARCVTKLPRPLIIDGPSLFNTSMEYLHGLGYARHP